MKYLALALTCFLFCGFQNDHQKNVIHPDNAKGQQQVVRPESSTKPTAPAQTTNKDAGNSGGQYEKTQDQKVTVVAVPEVRIEQRKDSFDWWMLFFTAVLAITGIIGTCFALQTLRAIRREVKIAVIALRHSSRLAKAAQNTAEAANKNAEATNKNVEAATLNAQASVLHAQAIVNSERPWMLIEIKPLPGTGAFTVGFRNCGRTPAEIVSFCQEIECRGTDGDFGLVAAPNYWDEQQILKYTRIVAPRQKWFNPGESTFWLEQNFIAEQWSDIKNSKKRAVYWGRLRYRDLIEIPKTVHQLNEVEAATLPASLHETCFCYWWSPALNDFLSGGPIMYNKNT